METTCADSVSFSGHGNETDWQRMYWNLVDSSGPTMKQVLDFIELGSGWSGSNHYSRLNVASGNASVSSTLEARWLSEAPAQGIDH